MIILGKMIQLEMIVDFVFHRTTTPIQIPGRCASSGIRRDLSLHKMLSHQALEKNDPRAADECMIRAGAPCICENGLEALKMQSMNREVSRYEVQISHSIRYLRHRFGGRLWTDKDIQHDIGIR
jgi:hypothetical protein